MIKNLATLSKEERDKIMVDLAAANIAFRERYGMPTILEKIEHEQPIHLLNWFHRRLVIHRMASIKLSRLPYEPKLSNR